MDSKRVVVFFALSFIFFSSCNKRKNAEPKIIVFQSCEIKDNVISIRLKNSHDKPIGKINYVDIYKGFIPDDVVYDENEVLINEDFSWACFDFNNGEEYKIYIRWFGGSLTVKTVYENNCFRMLSERYINKI